MKGTLTYRAEVRGQERIAFPVTQVQPEDPGIKRVAVAAEDGNRRCISVIVDFDNAPSKGAAMAVAKAEVHRILNRLSIEYNLAIAEPEVPESHCEVTTPDGMDILVGEVGHGTDCCIADKEPRLLTESEQKALQSFLGSPSSPADGKYGYLRSVLNSSDIVERYIFLYALLLQEKGPSQKKVDGFIKTTEPGVPMKASTNPHAPAGTMETIYTKLRNELSHVCPDRTLEDTRREMEQNVGKLLNLVKRAIVWP